LTAALAAALTTMAARFTDAPDPAGAAAAERLCDRASALADADVAAYGRYVQARRQYGRLSPETVDALDTAVDVPLQVAGIAAEVAGLARSLADDGNPRLRGDASTGCWLAAAAASSAALLVTENLAGSPADARVAQAHRYASSARAAAAGLVG
jgi:formiminotetrahydrofolate cyclodeaminase